MRFGIRILRSYTSAFERQIGESVWINDYLRQGIKMMNSRNEYNRCIIPRLRIDLGMDEDIAEYEENEREKEIKREIHKMKEKMRYEKEQQKSKRRKLNKEKETEKKEKVRKNTERNKKILIKGSKEKEKKSEIVNRVISLESKRNEKLEKIKEKKKRLIKKVIAQNKNKLEKKLENVFGTSEKKVERKQKKEGWRKFKEELNDVREGTSEIYNAVLGLIPERKEYSAAKIFTSDANIDVNIDVKLRELGFEAENRNEHEVRGEAEQDTITDLNVSVVTDVGVVTDDILANDADTDTVTNVLNKFANTDPNVLDFDVNTGEKVIIEMNDNVHDNIGPNVLDFGANTEMKHPHPTNNYHFNASKTRDNLDLDLVPASAPMTTAIPESEKDDDDDGESGDAKEVEAADYQDTWKSKSKDDLKTIKTNYKINDKIDELDNDTIDVDVEVGVKSENSNDNEETDARLQGALPKITNKTFPEGSDNSWIKLAASSSAASPIRAQILRGTVASKRALFDGLSRKDDDDEHPLKRLVRPRPKPLTPGSGSGKKNRGKKAKKTVVLPENQSLIREYFRGVER